MMTPLDKAYLAVRRDPNAAEDFYNLFLNTTLYMPVWDRLADVASRTLGPGDTLNPVLSYDGEKNYLMIFDTEQRLLDWADRDIGIACIAGHELVRLIDNPDVCWALNAGTDLAKEFTPDEIGVLRASMALIENS